MTNSLPIFPLEIVVFPGEHLNLHIFEPRYKQLINECASQKKPFGIPAVINNKVMEYGTSVSVIEIFKVYENGEMDVRTKGENMFRILEVIKEIPDKLFAGAIVNYPANRLQGNHITMQNLIADMRKLHDRLNVNKNFIKEDGELTSYDIAHHSGLSIEQEYEFLQLEDERQRQEYLKRHFAHILPGVEQLKNIVERIQMNGHFKNLQGFNF